jgi:N-acetylglucosaminylphosphatidylinositol deacetylase
MTTTWSSSSIADLLTSLFTKPGSKTRKQAGEHARGEAPQETTISVLITFDRGGVSGHPNHISLYHGAIEWVRGIMKGKGGWDSPVAVYTLGSVSIVRKYIGGLDALLTMVRTVAGTWGKAASDKPESLMFLNDALSYRQAQKAMTQAHKSQMRWFRWGWITIGRYMVVNDLKRERIV